MKNIPSQAISGVGHRALPGSGLSPVGRAKASIAVLRMDSLMLVRNPGGFLASVHNSFHLVEGSALVKVNRFRV